MIPEITNNIDKIIDACKQHYIKSLYVFGSATTEDFNVKSDIDLLYEFDEKKINVDANSSEKNYADNYFALKFGLEDLLKREVDLIEYKKFKNPYFSATVEQSKILLYAAS